MLHQMGVDDPERVRDVSVATRVHDEPPEEIVDRGQHPIALARINGAAPAVAVAL